jgi:hypothetical protein
MLEQLPVETFNYCMIYADQLYEADAMHADSHRSSCSNALGTLSGSKMRSCTARVGSRLHCKLPRGKKHSLTIKFLSRPHSGGWT